MPNPEMNLSAHSNLLVRQLHEVAEWVGFETRNKYQVLDEKGSPVAFAAEQQKGFFGFLLRQFLGHWRSFEVHVYNSSRQPSLITRQPFRFIFQRLEVREVDGRYLGAIQQRFSILSKRFDVLDEQGRVTLKVASPLFKFWTFPFTRFGKKVACIQKKWSGVFLEAFTDKDTFLIEYIHPDLSEDDRALILSAALFIDLRYFEAKAGR